MKKIYWGSFFIAIGVLFLLSNLGLLDFDFSIVRRFWPVLFILWGISIMVNNRHVKIVLTFLSAFLIAGVIFAMFNGVGSGIKRVTTWQIDTDSTKTVDFAQPLDSNITEAELNFNGGAGEFILRDTTYQLISGIHYGNDAKADLKQKAIDNKAILQLDIGNFSNVVRNGTLTKRTIIKLNKKPVWDLNFSLGAADTELNLSEFKVRDISIDAGAASVDLVIGTMQPQTQVEISAGASSVTIRVPKSAYCSVSSESALSSIDTDEGFTETSDNQHQTDNQKTAKSTIEIKVETGVSSVEIVRY